VKDQRTSAITKGITEVNSVVKDYTKLFEELFKLLTTLQEDPNIQHLETEAHKLQQQYDDIKGTAQMVALT